MWGGAGGGLDGDLVAVGEEVGVAVAAAVLDVIVDGVVVAGGGLEGEEDGLGHGTAGEGEAFAYLEVFEPTLGGDEAVGAPELAVIVHGVSLGHLRRGLEAAVLAIQRVEHHVGVFAGHPGRAEMRVEEAEIDRRDVAQRGARLGVGDGGGSKGGGAAGGQGGGGLVGRGGGEVMRQPTERMCHISPSSVRGACTPAPGIGVKRLLR